jgi:hypothetical protein
MLQVFVLAINYLYTLDIFDRFDLVFYGSWEGLTRYVPEYTIVTIMGLVDF